MEKLKPQSKVRFVPAPVKRTINNAFKTFKKKVLSLYPM